MTDPLQRDGLVIRHDFSEVPPRVEHELSDTGMELLVRMILLWTWIVENADRFREDRLKYDKNNSNPMT
ncbi:winged helix-turn-helix transcriptional regulator [Serratia liquefaciens]|uniref:winged helix-turn-helix transcriptional regulator n=1 Tax=Serratia liquefaciens TaxID=614 RepID=UPI0038053DF7